MAEDSEDVMSIFLIGLKKALQVSFIQDTLHTGAVMPPSPGVIGVGGG